MLLGFLLGSVDGIKLVPNEVIVLVKSLGVLDGLLLGKYDGIEIGSSECSADRNKLVTDRFTELVF